MPDKYDRAFCVTELRLRDIALKQVQAGWGPIVSFEAPVPPDQLTLEGTCVINAENSQPTQISPDVPDDTLLKEEGEETSRPCESDVDSTTSPGTATQCASDLEEVDISDLWA